MTVLSRGARNRRGGRRPGWLLLTALLVLAIGSSSALVFTNRVELLKLAVILALWAAVVAAFVSVIYRRQSDIDQARARDLKLVYDLQLDREISARREYELSVESHLRRELAIELRAQAADEVAALRAELAALRANLEVLFDADLSHRPALEGDWTRDTTTIPVTPGRVQSSRITPVSQPDTDTGVRPAENPIIDVPEEPVPTPPRRQRAEAAPPEPPEHGRHWTAADGRPEPAMQQAPEPPAPRARHSSEAPDQGPAMSTAKARAAAKPPATSRRRRALPEPEPEPEEPQGQHAGGQSVADLLARLQSNGNTGGGGRRRRRED